ncbi:unnamed protein product [Schistosoma margrebowiei]|uniref:EF-hand domain-containing protein n=2 Tax=Schistosoma margrebowiei TaxID=48269 RepID=A0AA84Z750_9TREM|nr:unnamed protein product [Schistosoma margrebowiei]
MTSLKSISCDQKGFLNHSYFFYNFLKTSNHSLYILQIMPRCLSSEELMELFNALDNNGDGVVSRQELTTCLVKAGISMAKVEQVMNQLDLNRDGFITLDEFKTALGLNKEPAAEWRRLFMQMDQDRSGEIDVNELQSLFDEAGMTVSRSVLDEWIRENDVDEEEENSLRSPINTMSNKEQLIRLFHKLDESGDGIISCDELYSGLSKAGVSRNVIQKIMDRLDLNGDGKVTFSEYEIAIGINSN